MSPHPPFFSKIRHNLAIAVLCLTFVMVSVGAIVTSADAGLSIPDPVTNHGSIIPSEALRSGYVDPSGRQYSGHDVFYEFFHRAIGWSLGALVISLAWICYRGESRPAVRKLALGAVLYVGLQGAVGAIGVQLRQPPFIVVTHALLAHGFLSLAVVLAFLTSREGCAPAAFPAAATPRGLHAIVILAFFQVGFGATFRHANSPAGLLLHIVGALAFAGLAAWFATLAQTDARFQKFTKHALAHGGVVMLQIFLGFLAWFFRRPKNTEIERTLLQIAIPSLHVITGAALTVSSVLLLARVTRHAVRESSAGVVSPSAAVPANS